MKSILISIRREHNKNIESGIKTSELRTMPPKIKPPFKVYTYESGIDGRHKITNEWICNSMTEFRMCVGLPAHLSRVACVSNNYIWEYCNRGDKNITEMRISNLVVYDKPKELSEFYTWKKCNSCRDTGYESTACCYDIDCKVPAVISRPPQNWCYVEEI